MGIKESKKYALGSIHENGSGKFEILDRYLDEDTNLIMIKYRYLGKEEVEVNKEINVNASIWKFKKVRGLTGCNKKEEETEDMLDSIMKAFDKLHERFDEEVKAHHSNQEEINFIKEDAKEQMNLIKCLIDLIKSQQSQLDTLVKENQIINKLLEKI